MRTDKFTAQEAIFVDDISFGDLHRAIEGIDLLIGVAKRLEIDMVTDQKAMVGIGVFIDADGHNIDVGPLFVKFEEAGKLFDAGCAIGRPEIEDDGVAPQLTEVYAIGAIAQGELRSEFIDIAGMLTTVAACRYQQKKEETW